MAYTFTEEDFDLIAKVLEAPAERRQRKVCYDISNEDQERRVRLEITHDLKEPGKVAAGSVVTARTRSAHLHLHACTRFMALEDLGEVIFFARHGSVVHGLVVERGAWCQIFSNYDERTLSGDPTEMSPEMTAAWFTLCMAEEAYSNLELDS